MRSLEAAYRAQRQVLEQFDCVGAYKVGGSNIASSCHFGEERVLVGGLPSERIYLGDNSFFEGLGEVEVCVRIEPARCPTGFIAKESVWGLELPYLGGPEDKGIAATAVATNLGSGSLQLSDSNAECSDEVNVYLDGKLAAVACTGQLVMPIEKILAKAVEVIREHRLPFPSSGIWIATGGLTSLIAVKKGQTVEYRSH